MEHFGLRLNRRKEGHFLTKENYARINKRSSLIKDQFDDFVLFDKHKKLPNEWSIWYLSKLLFHYEEIESKKRNKLEQKRILFIKDLLFNYFHTTEEEIERYQKTNFSDIIKLLDENQTNEYKKFITHIHMYDWDSDILGRYYSDSWCQKQFVDVMENLDLNMEFFKHLDHKEFENEIKTFQKKNPHFIEISDLGHYLESPGYYMMVIDQYKQLYIGTSSQMGIRIKAHWNAIKPFDRLLFPMGSVDQSIIPFDSYRALDTTRIFIYETKDTFHVEDELINQFSPKFVANRMAGGIPKGLLHAITMMKSRKLKDDD